MKCYSQHKKPYGAKWATLHASTRLCRIKGEKVAKTTLYMMATLVLVGGNLCWAAGPATKTPQLLKPTDRGAPDKSLISADRYVQSLQHSIAKATQWAASRTNNETLWSEARTTVENLLSSEWRSGRLQGTKPAQAYFVRCDRMTMTQNDIDNGVLNIVVGVATHKPAEFVTFTVQQKTLVK